MAETQTLTITDESGGKDEIELPAGMVELIVPPELDPAEGIGDLVVASCAQRIHAVLHHSEEDSDDDLEAIEAAIMEQFEDRFGASFAEVTGHHH